MFTPTQRIDILKWSSLGLLCVSFVPVVAHGLFFFPVLQQYLQLGIVIGVVYLGYKKSREIWNA